MSRTTFASIASMASLVNGIPGLIAPDAMASLYGVTVDRQGVLLGQLLAGSYIGYAIINWTTRASSDVALRRGVGLGNLMAWSIGAVIWTYAASSGMTNALGWFGVGLTVVFTLGWAYFTFTDHAPESASMPAAARR